MKKILFPCFAILISACGPSAEQLAKENAYKDSLATAAVNEINQKALREQAVKDSITAVKEEIKAAIASQKIELQMAKEQLNSIKEFHFGRTASEKETQLRNQYAKIQAFEENIQGLEAQLKQ